MKKILLLGLVFLCGLFTFAQDSTSVQPEFWVKHRGGKSYTFYMRLQLPPDSCVYSSTFPPAGDCLPLGTRTTFAFTGEGTSIELTGPVKVRKGHWEKRFVRGGEQKMQVVKKKVGRKRVKDTIYTMKSVRNCYQSMEHYGSVTFSQTFVVKKIRIKNEDGTASRYRATGIIGQVQYRIGAKKPTKRLDRGDFDIGGTTKIKNFSINFPTHRRKTEKIASL